jgi:hypothetical protein
LLQGGL